MSRPSPSLELTNPGLSLERIAPKAGPGIVAIILLLFCLAAAFSAQRKDVTRGFDEVAHVSYVAALQHSGEIFPALETLRMLDPATFRFTSEPNYLNHPPFYYWLLARLGPALEGNPSAIFTHRLLNVLSAAIGLAALLSIGLVAGMERLRFYTYAIPLACIPVLAPIAGSVNPDNLAFAGGAIAIMSAWQLIATGRVAWLGAALAGLVVASLSKLTGLLLTGGMLAVVFAYLLWRGRFRRAWIFPVALAATLALAPYLFFLVHYGSPTPNTPGQIALLENGSKATGWADAARMPFLSYVLAFIAAFVADWMPALAERSALNYAALALPVGAVLCAAAGVAISLRRIFRREETTIDVIVVAGALAILATFSCNVLFSYGRHLATGWRMDAYPRYYLPLIAVVPLAGLSLLSALHAPRWRIALLAFLIAGPLLFRLLGGPLA
jgi:hypothetical protein